MSIETTWYIPGKVLYQRYHGIVTLEDVRQSSREAAERYQQVADHRQHYIIDMSDTGKLDVNLQGLRDLKPPEGNTGWSVVVANSNPLVNSFTKFMSVAASQFLGIRLRIVNTLSEAEAFLSEMDNEVASALAGRSA